MDILIADVIGDIALIMAAASVLGILARRCGQPAVVGQILAGILLGPSLLGRLDSRLEHHIFPAAALPSLTVMSQVAVAIFMFAVGYELDWSSCRQRYRPALLVAASAMLIPLGLGSGIAVVFRSSFATLGQAHLSHSFVIFMGVAIAITALPVLTAIMREHGISGTAAGVTATAAASLMDVAAWVVLAAALVGTASKPSRPWPVMLVLIICFAAFMLLAVRPVLRWWLARPRALLANPLPLALVLTLGSAWVTASLGLHPVFGGLLAGFTMPRKDGAPDPDVLRPMEDIGSVLLPLFFIVTGLSVNIGTMNGTSVMLLAVLVVAASAGKIGPGYVGSRIGGLSPRDAATVAVLVNTRGLTELIALNVGLTAGLISERLYSILVVMAILTTMVTAPLLRRIAPVDPDHCPPHSHQLVPERPAEAA
jgi:Kef-type K+ transport system membrane component KefB